MASLKLEVGKFYRTRDGDRVEIVSRDDHPTWPFNSSEGNAYQGDGFFYSCDRPNDLDIIAEWADAPTNPVRTVTRKELVPGLYGNVYVEKYEGQLGASMEFTADPAVIRAAIATLTKIADVLEENQ